MTGPTLETRGLTKRYGKFPALVGLDLRIEGPKCVGFLGPNGAGKTTTLKLLTDMIFPSEGECFLNGISVQRERKAALAATGVLIESPEIYPSLTPTQALEMVADLRNLSRAERAERIPAALADVKMSEWAHTKVGKFSKGMKQRVNLAAALVHDPEILLLDEPASGLDPRGMAEVRAIVRDLKLHDRLIFMSSHILAEVTDVCDEVALIHRGKLLFYDTLDRVTAQFSEGRSSVDASFATPLPERAVADQILRIPGVEKCELLDPRRVRLHFQGGLPAQSRLLHELDALGLGLATFQESKSALEEIYLSQIDRGD